MKKMMKSVLAVGCAAMLCTTLPVYAEDESASFDAFMDQIFMDVVSGDYMNLHFMVKDPEAMGIEKPEPTLGTVSYEDYEDSKKEAQDVLDQLDDYDRDDLSEKQQHDYDAIKYAYEFQLAAAEEPDFDWYFSPSNNVIGNLSTNMTEFVFYTAEDFTDYVSLLESMPAYIDSAMDLTEEQASKGYFMADPALDEVLQNIRDFIAKKEDNPIIVDFREELQNTDLIDESKKQGLDQEVTSTVQNELLPQCEEIANRLEALRGKGCQTGYHDMKDGPAYYEMVIRNTASTTKSVDEIFEDLETFLVKKIRALVLCDLEEEPGSVHMTEPEEDLAYLSESFHKHGFPKIEDVNYHVDYLDPTVVSGNVLAYYVGSPIDDYSENSIKVNDANVNDVNTLYESLAHEGYPGHLYQHVYYNGTKPAKIRQCFGFLGYTEGWAMYAETQALNWGVVSREDAAYLTNMTYVDYAVSALADLCVNGKGYDEQELSSYFGKMGLNEELGSMLYESALTHPFDYLSYGYGMTRLVTMREDAEEAMGSNFKEEEFNRILLDHGPRTLDAVEEDVDAWMDPFVKEVPASSYTLWLVVAGVCGAAVILTFVKKKRNKKEEWK